MKKFNRELLVLMTENTNQRQIDQEVEMLHELLFDFEQTEKLIMVHELIDINRRKIFGNGKKLKKVFKVQELKPFNFLNNLN